MSRQPFWVMEQQPGPVNWARWNPSPASGMVRLWTWEAFAHGADVVSYFRWRQAPFAQEQMHAGLHTPDRELDVGGREAAQVARELELVPQRATAQAPVALVFDYDARWLAQIHPQGADFDYLRQAFEAYGRLRSLGLDVDIVRAGASLDGYRLVVVPSLPLVKPATLDALKATDAQLIFFPRSGSKQETVTIADGLPPGVLRELMPVRITRVESLRPTVSDAVMLAGARHACVQWREHLAHGADVKAEACFADGSTAVARHGRVRYLAGCFDEAMLRKLFEAAARDAGLEPVSLPEGVRVRRRGDLLFVFNYNDTAREVRVPQAQWLVGGPAVAAHGVSIARHEP